MTTSVAPLAQLPRLLRGEPALGGIIGRRSATLAVPRAAQAFVLSGLCSLSQRSPFLVVTATMADAERLREDLGCFVASQDAPTPDQNGSKAQGPPRGHARIALPGEGERSPVVVFPPWETLPFERVSPDVGAMGHRLEVLWRLFGERGQSDRDRDDAVPPRVVIAPVRALLQRLGPWRDASRPLVVRRGQHLDTRGVLERLSAMGYRREHQVEHRGEMAVRGGIIDVFPSTADVPVRIDLFGDEVDRLTWFDVGDQRSVEDLESVSVFACRELVTTPAVRERAAALVTEQPWGARQWERIANGESFDGMEAWLPWLVPEASLLTDLLGPDAQVVVLEPKRTRDRAIELLEEEAALVAALAPTWGYHVQHQSDLEELPSLHLPFDRLLADCDAAVLMAPTSPEGPDIESVSVGTFPSAAGDASRLAKGLVDLTANGYSVTLCAATDFGARHLVEVLEGEGISATLVDSADPAPGIRVVTSTVSAGFVLPSLRVAVLSEQDITGRRMPHRKPRPRAARTDAFFEDLAPGSYVVHRQHGVARYAGMTTRALSGATRDYLLLEFRGTDRLYLPVEQIDAITPYSGGDSPTLSRMGGAEWQRARARARAAAGEIAEELVELYRRRLTATGHGFGADTPWQAELESSFPYVETEDQLRAIREVKADMEAERPMDRLVCGDVGFGKTEIAVRAVFKAVQDGMQAAVLVPTTLLASQHFQTFSERFAGFPVRVALLSRFLSNAEVRKVVAGIADGSVDVVIGTHRLLGADVRFKRLGLLVVDEEQRFGVGHKEAVKRLAEGVDVLTLTASPIPRTLEMALTGIRDLSLVNTPPADRRPILTYVGEYDEAAVCEAIRRELLREGQVFFVHNRVADIDAVARRLGELVPEARIAVAHGQMDEGSLEQVVIDFWQRAYDVLVCTTIIESGIDMPTVNTLVVDRADLLGLGQLHQLRGRVGRSDQRAYAYLFHPPDRVLPEQAYERLRTIGEHTELGSGFKIAMRDLQIRGAGNLLGRDQSGHIAAVGYDLYVQLVAEAVAEAKGELPATPPTLSIDLPGDAHLPTDYIEAEDARLEAYRRLASTETLGDVDDVGEEWADRFGPPPEPVLALLEMARLRVVCLRAGVTEVALLPGGGRGGRRLLARLSPISLAASAQVRLQRLEPDASYREPLRQLLVPVDPKRAAWDLRELLEQLLPQPALASVAAGSSP